MSLLSVVIITRNEENNIVECIHSAKQITSDIIVVDCGSNDRTVALAQQEGAHTFVIDWQGFGFSRNFGAARAKHDWVLALDADERISKELAAAIQKTKFGSQNLLFKFGRKNYIGSRPIRFGTPGFENVKRLYNRNCCRWDLTLVHEKLISTQPLVVKQIRGQLIHFGWKSFEDYKKRAVLYARMSAEKYAQEGKKAGWVKRMGSPLFNSIKSYVFQLGFLEGRTGFKLSAIIGYYSWLKYDYLNQLLSSTESKEAVYSPSRKMETISN